MKLQQGFIPDSAADSVGQQLVEALVAFADAVLHATGDRGIARLERWVHLVNG
jgi:hypothetical protein